MSNFAVVEDGIVLNIIVAESKEIAESLVGKTCIEYTDENVAFIGLGWDGTRFENPPPPPVPVVEHIDPVDELLIETEEA
jgi:hypothetical protein